MGNLRKYRMHLMYIAIGILMVLLFSLQKDLDQTYEKEVSCLVNDEGITDVKDSLVLRRGHYTVSVSVIVEGTMDDAVIEFYSLENGILLQSTISNGIPINSYQLSIDRPDEFIFIKVNGVPGRTVNIQKIAVYSEKPLFNDYCIVMIVFIALYIIFGLYFLSNRKCSTNIIIAFVLIYGVVLASYPLFSDYLIDGHDLRFHLYRIEGLKAGLQSGQFPVRIDPVHNAGYGYATATMYPNLFLYFPAILRLRGVSMVMSYQILLISINTLTALIMYYSI